MWHMACSYHMEDNRTDVILFGGNIRRRSQAEKHVQTGLTIFSYGKSTYNMLASFPVLPTPAFVSQP